VQIQQVKDHMHLTSFITDLLEKGQVTVTKGLTLFSEEDLQETASVLEQYYKQDVLEMPFIAPAFSSQAALWGVTYLYRATQFALIRDLGEEAVQAHLTDFSGPITPEAIYSADLTLRYLPDLLHLAKGLAPDDVLVTCIKTTLARWPFSSAGTAGLGEVEHGPVWAHKSLKYAYIDRIIKHKDTERAYQEPVAELIREVLGEYAAILWPGLANKQHIQ
jgi:hypothetical protein